MIRRPSIFHLGLLLKLTLPLCLGIAAEPPVSIEIALPTRKTHVIGDATELNWRFTNRSTNLLAFMWEGCCRINGRVDMKRQGPPVIPKGGIRPRHSGFGPGIYSPSCLHCRLERQKSELNVGAAPMGPATAHMFARAVRLPAGNTEEISSLLSNWVLLEESGDYLLTGNYLGVHPKQSPQMPKGAGLWTDISISKPIELTLLSVSDYLAESGPRGTLRGLAIQLTKAGDVKPFSDLGFKVSLSNQTSTNITLHWPGQAEFWIIDKQGRRLADSRHVVTRYGDPLVILPGKTATVDLPVSSDIFAGNEFGSYRAFVELKETEQHLRTPSMPVAIDWRLSPETVIQLLHEAGDRPAVGHRNPALKLLRQHLQDLRETFSSLLTNGLGPKSAALAKDLGEASILGQLHPRPGQVSLHLSIPAQGPPSIQDPAALRALGHLRTRPVEMLQRVIDLRRHLGWSVGLTLRIMPESPLAAINKLLVEIAPARDSMSGPPETKAFNRNATAYSRITFAAAGSPANPDDLVYSPGRAVEMKATPAAIRLVCPSTLTWADVLLAAAPLIDEGRAFELLIRDSP